MPFYIQNITTGLVLDIGRRQKEPNGKIIMFPYHGGENQLWTMKKGMILSKLNYLALTVGAVKSDGLKHLTTKPAESLNTQLWYLDDDHTIRSGSEGLVINVKGDNRNVLAEVIAYPKHVVANDQFRIVFI